MQNMDVRNQTWQDLNQNWDMIIIGGGITGAGIFRMAAQAGYKVLLLEANDYAFGTSSRSSKLIHGGLRYIKNRQYKVTLESVRERERLLHEAPNLVTPLEFILPVYDFYHTDPKIFDLSLAIYDVFGHKWQHGLLSDKEENNIQTQFSQKGLLASFFYFDAVLDDARLVYRNIREGELFGGKALNYVVVQKLLFNSYGQVCGVAISDNEFKTEFRNLELFTQVVINATGPWTDTLRAQVSKEKIIRKLRGSHIQFLNSRLPIEQAFSFIHPIDHRSLFVIPWEGVTIVGTTDLDHPIDIEKSKSEPFMTPGELDYLLVAANHLFPGFNLDEKDIISSFAGLRPVLYGGKESPSDESRAHRILEESGLITIAGGKLTTYRKMGYEVLIKAQKRIKQKKLIDQKKPVLNKFEFEYFREYPIELINRWSGRFGKEVTDFLESLRNNEDQRIENSSAYWAEIRWSARNEAIVHLDDLLLRRVRIGLLLPNGGLNNMSQIKDIVKAELKWNDEKWQTELIRYETLWKDCYYLPK